MWSLIDAVPFPHNNTIMYEYISNQRSPLHLRANKARLYKMASMILRKRCASFAMKNDSKLYEGVGSH